MMPKSTAPRLALLAAWLVAAPKLILWGQVQPSSGDGITPAMLEAGTPAGSYELS
jgi:hypothetical protein